MRAAKTRKEGASQAVCSHLPSHYCIEWFGGHEVTSSTRFAILIEHLIHSMM